jgi:uncharacterized protein
MLISAISAALVMGLFGGVHCAAMCGPLAIAGCSAHGRMHARAALEYIAGRFVAYTLIGAVFGAFGRAIESSNFAFARAAIALVLAVLFLIKGVRLLRPRAEPELVTLRSKRRRFALFALPALGLGLGLFTGLLPCGLLYGAFALAATSSSAIDGALVMAAFAAASLPALFAPVLLARRLPMFRSPKWQGVLWCALGLWLSLRPVLDVFTCSHGGGCHG